jgi:hypothetical protein
MQRWPLAGRYLAWGTPPLYAVGTRHLLFETLRGSRLSAAR